MYLPNISDEVYFAMSEVSNSTLSALDRETSGRPEPNPANYRIGSLVDCMVTSPDKVNDLLMTAHGVQYTQSEFDLAYAMVNDFNRSPYASICKGINQAVFVRDLTVSGFTASCRCKADIWCTGAKAGVDLKTTVASTQAQFEKMIEVLSYDRQSAFYADVMEVDKFLILGISKTARKIFPYLVRRGDECYMRGKEKYENLLYRWVMMFGDISNSYLKHG